MKRVVPELHVYNALDGYLKALSIIHDNEVVVSLAHNTKTGDYTVETVKDTVKHD